MKLSAKEWISRVGIVLVAAILVEIISVVQYRRTMAMMEREADIRIRIVLGALTDNISNELRLTEVTMKENLWEVQRGLSNPDSALTCISYLIDDNPHVLGGCLAFVPGYFPGKDGLYEPYGRKEGGRIILEDIASGSHDYTLNPAYISVMESGKPEWSDPYRYGPDSTSLATYSYPIYDSGGRLAAVCGLDLDLSWLGDTLNSHQRFASSFGILLTRDGKLVAGPAESKIPASRVQQAVDIVNGVIDESSVKDITIKTASLKRAPYWKLAQVYSRSEVSAPMRKMRLEHLLMVLLGLGILAFMLNRYARSEKKLREASAQQARLSAELSVARGIQKEMLPKAFPDNIFGLLEPAREVGGDLFDFYRRDGKLFFCIGDVSGKGVPSAMLMSVIHSLFRIVSEKEESPSRILTLLNAQACRDNDTNMFVTFFVGCLDLYTGRFRFSNAGHDKPFILSDSVSVLPARANLPLGVFPDTTFKEQAIQLSPGTSIFLYTDGLSEAKNRQREAFGVSRVKEALSKSLGESLSPEQTVSAFRESAFKFTGDAPQADDLTMLMVRYAPSNLFSEHLELSNKIDEVSRLSAFLKSLCVKLELEGKLGLSIRLAVEEMVVNVISYAYPSPKKGTVTIYADSDYKELRFTIVDKGIPFDPTAVVPASTTLSAEQRPIGGLGILLSRQIMDSVSYCRKADQNVLTLTKSIV
ncbi:MAG: SpoIIE family protein phosphatase [Bacteroidales bacterium]|nr:SpoIIE family protein phosphatase [Bacteroidales bacterium]